MSLVLTVFLTVTPLETPEEIRSAMGNISSHNLNLRETIPSGGVRAIQPLLLSEKELQLCPQSSPSHPDMRTPRSD